MSAAPLIHKDADLFGLRVRIGADGKETVIGYDTTTHKVYVDRTRSAAVDSNSAFPGVRTAPPEALKALKAENGKVEPRILVG